MSSLGPTASLNEIEDELVFQQTLLESLADVGDNDESKAAILRAVTDLESRLDAFSASTPASGDSEQSHAATALTPVADSDDSLSVIDSTVVNKRRLTPSPDRTNVKKRATSSTMQRYLQAEAQARRRRDIEAADAAYALQLSQQQIASPPTPAASTFSTAQQMPSSQPNQSASSASCQPSHPYQPPRPYQPPQPYQHPQHQNQRAVPGQVQNGPGFSAALPSHTRSPFAAPASTTPTYQTFLHRSQAVKSEPRPSPSPHGLANTASDIVDLTGSDDEESVAYPPFANHNALAGQHGVDAALRPNGMAGAAHRIQIPGTANGVFVDERSRQAFLDERRRRAEELRAVHFARLQAEQARRQSAHVYNVPGAFPGGSQYPYIIPPTGGLPSIYEPQRAQPSTFFSDLTRSLSHWHDDLTSLMGGPASVRAPVHYPEFDEPADPEQIAEDLKNLMDNIRPDEDLPAEVQDVEIESMTVKLKPYQGVGLTWLQNMEDGTSKGSVLADDMGLGKTVQAIALMSTRRSESQSNRTNLIICPVALLRQWKEEIATKLKRGRHALSVFTHHGPTKRKTHEELRMYDVVITTFGSIAGEMRKRDRFLARKEQDPNTVERPDEKCLLIGDNCDWYRVIIDEAQNVKNRNTQSSRGVCHLRAKFRLCMTGTPMMNNVEELYSLIKFLRIKPYNDLNRFMSDFGRPIKGSNDDARKRAMQKLQVLLKAILLRRHKKSTMNGKPILILPERIIGITNPDFSAEERDFYTALETQSRTQFNKYVAARTVGRSYAHILVMLLRLRQACCHPHLVKDFAVQAASELSQEAMEEIAESLDPAVVERIKQSNGEFECPVCYDAVENPAIFLCGHEFCPDCYIKIKDAAAENGDTSGTAKCPNCREMIDPKKVIDYETFKKVHVPVAAADNAGPAAIEAAGSETETDPDATASEADDDDPDSDSETESEDDGSETDSLDGFVVYDDDVASGKHPKLSDRKKGKAPLAPIFKTSNRPGGLQFSDDEDDETPGSVTNKDEEPGTSLMAVPKTKPSKLSKKRSKSKSKSKSKKKAKGKGKDKKAEKKKAQSKSLAELKKLASRNKTAKREYLRRLREDFVMSAKVEKTVELLKDIIDNTDEKIIVFSQWTSLLDLLEVPINDEAWRYRRYDGSMSARDRADAIDEFKSESGRVRLMLVSLKAGNAGLNLNCASQVIILDPFWNPYIEEQAIDRAHRLGQTREVKVHRLLIPETVEDRIMALQDNKRAMINEALDESAGQRLSRLGQEELGYLFGVTRALPSS